MIRSFQGTKPTIAESAYIDPTAVIIGDVNIEAEASVWPNAVLRADGGGTITIREGANVQDSVVSHADSPNRSVEIKQLATIGHSAIVHNAMVGKRSLVGMNAVMLNDAVLEDYAIVAAGSVVREEQVVESQTLVGGTPASVISSDVDKSNSLFTNGESYVERAKRHMAESEDITDEYH